MTSLTTFEDSGRSSNTLPKSSSASAAFDDAARSDRESTYNEYLWYFLAAVVATISIAHWINRIACLQFSKKTRNTTGDPEQHSTRTVRRAFSIRRLPVAIINAYRVVAFRWNLTIWDTYTINIAEVFLTSTYIIALFVWTFINTTPLETGIPLTLNFWDKRSGTLAVSQLPLIAVLGTKNNIIAFVTGVGHEKLNYLHRMTARVLLVLVWVHGASKMQDLADFDLIKSGLVAGGAFSFLCLFSLRPIRKKNYELFFYTHAIMVITILVSGYYHTIQRKPFDIYVSSSCVIWGFDRLVRAIRLVVFNHSYFGIKQGSGIMDATAELLSPNFIRLKLRRPPHFHWKAGQTTYLIVPSVSSLRIEAHPFTIASFDPPPSNLDINKVSGETKDVDQMALDSTTAPYGKELVFFINVRGGFTKRLAVAAANGQTFKALIDGPYGTSRCLRHFDTSILIAGGTGISYTLPVFLDILNSVRSGSSACTKVVFIWSTREADHIGWMMETLSQAVLLLPSGLLDVQVNIYVTGTSSSSPVENECAQSSSDVKDAESSTATDTRQASSPALFGLTTMNRYEGRPDLPALLQAEIQASATDCKISVDVCGSQSMAQSVRAGLRFPVSGPSSVLFGGASVTLHVESFGYA